MYSAAQADDGMLRCGAVGTEGKEGCSGPWRSDSCGRLGGISAPSDAALNSQH